MTQPIDPGDEASLMATEGDTELHPTRAFWYALTSAAFAWLMIAMIIYGVWRWLD